MPNIQDALASDPYIEFSDSASFFSSRTQGWRIKKARLINNAQEVTLYEGRCVAQHVHKKNNISIDSTLNITALNDTFLIDCVIGLSFKKKMFEVARIGSGTITHTDSKKRHEYPVRRCSLHHAHYSAHIEIIDTQTHDICTPVIYIRDMPEVWVMHCRLLPKIIAKSVIKLNTPLYNKAIPQSISNILLNYAWLKKWLWYRSERKPYPLWNLFCKILNPSAVPLARLPQNKSLSLSVRVTMRPE